jgi:hypothetical protein
MPYIPENRRVALSDDYAKVKGAGELNYKLTLECLSYLEETGLSYQTINDIIGALECAKQEFYRRQLAIYEDQKIVENGDIH